MDRMDVKRWTKISLRTLHLLGALGVGGGVIFGVDKALWLDYWWLALASGVLIMLMDMVANPAWIVQVRGLVIVLKLALLVFLGLNPEWDKLLLLAIVIMSAVISHAPGKLRYYSVYHRKTIESNKDSKG